jgi:tripartite-type tricarboxylate transporter receptor subunit TctC
VTRKFTLITVLFILAVTSCVLSCTAKAQPATASEYFKGKTIEFVVSSSAGSTPDLVSRVIASYLSRDTGATAIVINKDGAGGIEGMNYLYQGKPDGLTMGTTSSVKFVSNKVMNEPAATYDIEKYSYIMVVDPQPVHFFVSPDGPYQSVADLKAGKDLKIGASSPSGLHALGGLTVLKLLGLNAKVVTGFNEESQRSLAVKRGEIIGYTTGIQGAKAGIEGGMIKSLFILSTKRDPRTPDVPAITELVKLSGDDLELVKLWETALAASTLFMAPPGMPEDKLAFLRDLANKWVQNKDFRAEIDTVSGAAVKTFITGDDATRGMREMASALSRFQTIFSELIKKYRA